MQSGLPATNRFWPFLAVHKAKKDAGPEQRIPPQWPSQRSGQIQLPTEVIQPDGQTKHPNVVQTNLTPISWLFDNLLSKRFKTYTVQYQTWEKLWTPTSEESLRRAHVGLTSGEDFLVWFLMVSLYNYIYIIYNHNIIYNQWRYDHIIQISPNIHRVFWYSQESDCIALCFLNHLSSPAAPQQIEPAIASSRMKLPGNLVKKILGTWKKRSWLWFENWRKRMNKLTVFEYPSVVSYIVCLVKAVQTLPAANSSLWGLQYRNVLMNIPMRYVPTFRNSKLKACSIPRSSCCSFYAQCPQRIWVL